jgi:tetratricopeptide (TPR) repeat protein
VSILLLAGVPAQPQRHKFTINTETPEGQLLAQIGQEEDAAKKLALLEQFAEKFPKHEGAAWVLSQMIPAYNKAGQFDKALQIADKLLTMDPGDLESGHAAVQAAQGKQDPDAVMAWAARVSDLARKALQSAKPADEEEAEEWKRRVDFAKQLDVFTEYALYAMALQSTDAAKKVALIELLEQRNPQSQYVPQVAGQLFNAYMQSGQTPKAIALAEKVLEKDQTNEGMMLAVADSYRNQQKEPAKVYALCAKVVELAKTTPKPQSVDDAAWQQRQAQLTGRAQYIAGVMYAIESKWIEADESLRASLPGIKDDQNMTAEALIYLGLANFRLGEKGDINRIADAVRFNEQCAAIPGPYQARAKTNLTAIRRQYRVK